MVPKSCHQVREPSILLVLCFRRLRCNRRHNDRRLRPRHARRRFQSHPRRHILQRAISHDDEDTHVLSYDLDTSPEDLYQSLLDPITVLVLDLEPVTRTRLGCGREAQ